MRHDWVRAGLFAAALAAASVVAQERRPETQEPRSETQGPAAESQGALSGAREPVPGAQDPARSAQQPSAGAQAPADGADEPAAGVDEGADETVADAGADDEVPYTVECGADPEAGGNVCQVDRDTYVGWRTFHSVCHTCHAQDAVGSSFAPALLPRIRMIDKARFLEVVDKGFTGQVGVMPGWGTNPNVNRYYDELWAYLRARADGVLPPGRPKRLPDD